MIENSNTGSISKSTVTHDIIANNMYILWSGELNQAYLTAPTFIQDFFLQNFYPLQQYLAEISNIKNASIDYANVLEWLFFKRFQELFKIQGTAADKLPSFFGIEAGSGENL